MLLWEALGLGWGAEGHHTSFMYRTLRAHFTYPSFILSITLRSPVMSCCWK